VGFLSIFQSLAQLNLHLLHHAVVTRVNLVLAVGLHLLQLVDSGLELLRSFFKVTLRLVSLLLQEGEATLPQGLVFVVVVDGVLELTVHFRALLPRKFQL